jgi:hypothetical protein
MVRSIKFTIPNAPFKKENMDRLNLIPFKLPVNFIELLRMADGGNIDYDFDYHDVDSDKAMSDGIAFIYGLNSNENLIDNYLKPAEFFPNNLLAFGENGGGNFICFDYRNNPKTNDPPIVYWDHEADVGKDVSFIANNFDDFLEMLKESETK